MLKRQRPVSPPPSSDVPLIAIDISHQNHEAKRRRILAPVLDGEKRGWGIPHQESYDDDDDETELQEYPERTDVENEAQSQDSGMYKSTNTFLHDLHALHQHRLIFSGSSTSTPSSSNLSSQQRQASSSPLRTPSSQYSQSSYDNTPTKFNLPPISERSSISSFDDQDLNTEKDGCDVGDGMTLCEVQRVKERYEDTNRLLGSLVLSRRRELQGGPDGT